MQALKGTENFVVDLIVLSVANALACNAGDDGFAPDQRRYFKDLLLELMRSLAQRPRGTLNGLCGDAGIYCDLQRQR